MKKYIKKFWENVYLTTAPETDQINLPHNNQSEPSNLEQFLHPSGFFSQHQISADCEEFQEYIKDSPVPCNNLLE
jgi:hypothetical protein